MLQKFIQRDRERERERERNGVVDGRVGAGAVSEAEESVGVSNGLSGSGVVPEYSVDVLLGERPSVSAQPQVFH